MNLFLDTSALAKRYIREVGSDEVWGLCEEADTLSLSVICLPELISTLSRLVRERKISKSDYARLKSRAITELADADICQMTPEVTANAVRLIESHPLRAMDAIHVACAQLVRADVFASADERQLKAAKKAGLEIADVSQ